MQDWLGALPAWLGVLLFTLVPAILAVGAHAIFRRFVRPSYLIEHHDVAGFIVAVVGVLYAVVLGFVVVTVWSSFDTAQRNADAEAGVVGELFVLSQTFPEPARTRVRGLLADYAYEVRDREWPILGKGLQDPKAREFALAAFEAVNTMPWPKNDDVAAIKESVVRTAAFNDFHELGVRRRQRLLDAGGGIQSVLYFALVVGALIVLAFAFLFGVERALPQLVMTGLLAGLMGLLIGLVAEFDRPFNAAVRVSPDAWTLVIENNDMDRYRDRGASAGGVR
jgi:hypothetical protein